MPGCLFFLCLGVLKADYPPHYEEALRFFEQADYDRSLAVIRSKFADFKDSYEIRMLAGANYARLNKYESAIAHLKICVAMYPNRPESRAFLAGLYRKIGRYNLGERVVREGLRLFSNSAVLRQELSLILYKSGKYKGARRQIEILLGQDGGHFMSVYLDGLILFRQGDYANAQFRLRHALELSAKQETNLRADLHYNMGRTIAKRGAALQKLAKFSEATELYREALSHHEKAVAINAQHALAPKSLFLLRSLLAESDG